MTNRFPQIISLSALILLHLISGPLLGQDIAPGDPPKPTLETIRTLVHGASPQHPRLFADARDFRAVRQAIARGGIHQTLADAVIRQAEAMMELPPISRTLEGRRLLGESRRCVRRTITLAMAFQLTGDTRFAARCEQEMLAAADFSDWNPSHFLDVAEMALALAVGYDWTFETLNEPARNTIRSALVEKALRLPWETTHRDWVRATNNWGQVCHGGLTTAALAIMEDEPGLAAATIHSAVHNVVPAMTAYAPNGGYPEGPAYWAYGTSYNVLLIAALERALGSDLGLIQAPGFALTGQFPVLMTGPSGLFFNYADGDSERRPEAALYWLALRFQRPDWRYGENRRLLARLEAGGDATGGEDRLLPLALLWLPEPADEPPLHVPLHWHSQGEVPVSVHRSSWTDRNATYLGFKAGSPSSNHGHMDIGSFVLEADGVRWALDLGLEGYHRIEALGINLWDRSQGSERWTIFRQQNQGHNTLVIDGKLQQVAGFGEIVRFSEGPAFPHSVADLSTVYAGQAGSVRRGVALLPSREVLIQDELAGLTPGSLVRWGMITAATPGPGPGQIMELRSGDSRLTLTLLEPAAAKWQVIDTEAPRRPWDSPNPGTAMLAVEVPAPGSGALVIRVLATPGSCTESVGESLQRRPLADWGSD